MRALSNQEKLQIMLWYFWNYVITNIMVQATCFSVYEYTFFSILDLCSAWRQICCNSNCSVKHLNVKSWWTTGERQWSFSQMASMWRSFTLSFWRDRMSAPTWKGGAVIKGNTPKKRFQKWRNTWLIKRNHQNKYLLHPSLINSIYYKI